MRVLLAHSFYQQHGGEDSVVEAELALLRDNGHEVETCFAHNNAMSEMSAPGAALRTVWSRRDHAAMGQRIRAFKPDVVHVHNTFQALSPAVLQAVSAAKVPLVQTLHNFRLICPQAILLRDGKVCEDCVGKVPWRGVVRGCYRGSVAQTAVLSTMLMVHRALGTYEGEVDRFVALSEFSRRKLIEGGLPANRISVKPNFFDWPELPDEVGRDGGLFIGRLSQEKGIGVLLAARREHGLTDVAVIGSGEAYEREVAEAFGPAYLGFQPLDAVVTRLRQASFLVLPSICYENFPRTIVEAFACGVPVLASRMGAMAELVDDGVTGLLFAPGDARDLAAKVAWAKAHPAEMLAMGRHARAVYDARYRPQANHEALLTIYRLAHEHRAMRAGRAHG